MSVQWMNALVLLGSLCAAVWAFSIDRPPPPKASAFASPLDALPPGAVLVASVDLARLRAAFPEAVRPVDPTEEARTVCGFDPLASVERLAIAVDGLTESSTDFGVAAVGRMSAERFSDCAERMLRQRGGRPLATNVGSFVTVRDRNRSDGGESAVRDDGPLMLSGGAYLRRMIDAAEGTGARLSDDTRHAALRNAVGQGGALVITWTPGPGALGDVTDEIGPSARVLETIRAVAASVTVGPSIQLHVLVVCATESGCRGVESWVSSARTIWGPLASVVRAPERTLVEKRELRATWSLDRATAERLARSISSALDESTRNARRPEHGLAPDAVVRPEPRLAPDAGVRPEP